MIEEGTIIRDSEGYIRIPDIVFTTAEVNELIETIYLKCGGLNCKIQQLNRTFAEHDRGRSVPGPRGVMRNWTDEERKYVLLHHAEDNDKIGEGIGRTFMAVKHEKSNLLSDFLEWKEKHPEHNNLTYEEQVDKFME